jgi:hypothetical protein
VNILQACSDPKVFGQHLRSPTWGVWYVFLAALFALPMTPEQLATYTKHTGRATPPTTPMHEAWLVCGRRAGKSFVLALIATYLACFKDWRPFLGPGETATVMLVAADRKQARVIKRYIAGLLKAVPMLAQLITNETRESISLRNRVVIEIHTASYKTTRGYWIVAALLDEVAYWPTDETALMLRSSTRSAPRWQQSRMPFCWPHRAHMHVGGRCGRCIASTTAVTTRRFWCGRPTHAA